MSSYLWKMLHTLALDISSSVDKFHIVTHQFLQNHFFHFCCVHICPRCAAPTSAVNYGRPGSNSAPFSIMLLYYYAIIKHPLSFCGEFWGWKHILYIKSSSTCKLCHRFRFPVFLPMLINLSVDLDVQMFCLSVCCMLLLLHVLHSSEKWNAGLTQS